jgi:hypothetical protein
VDCNNAWVNRVVGPAGEILALSAATITSSVRHAGPEESGTRRIRGSTGSCWRPSNGSSGLHTGRLPSWGTLFVEKFPHPSDGPSGTLKVKGLHSRDETDTGGSMGDKGGKKDKEKNQQQLAQKQKQKEQKRQDKVPARTAAAVNT